MRIDDINAFDFEIVSLTEDVLRVISNIHKPIPIIEGVGLLDSKYVVGNLGIFQKVVLVALV